MNCAALPLGTNRKTSAQNSSSPLAPSSSQNTFNTDLHHSSFFRAEGKENVTDMESKSWLSKVCNKLRSKHRRPEKCEKCGQRSETCLPNPSFISGRKHFLCQDCRVSAHNMKTMYHQLCRNLSLRDHSRTTTCNSGDLSSPGSCPGGLSRSRFMKARPTSPESGYETATSVDSSSSERLSADPASTSSRECSGLSTRLPLHHPVDGSSKNAAVDLCSKDKAEVFGGAFSSEKAHLHHLQKAKPAQRTYTRHPPALPPSQNTKVSPNHPKNTTSATKQYDGYLEIRTPKSRSVKYVFKKPEGVEGDVQRTGVVVVGEKQRRGKGGEGLKECYRCHKSRIVAFRAPFGHGWVCENCMDDLM
ncbi:hypothetical protein ACOMHN_065381 [Nucella lapillus]